MNKTAAKFSNFLVFTLLAWLFAAQSVAAQKTSGVRSVTLDTKSFNASRGEKVKLTYELTRPDKVTVRVYDPDGGLVATLLNGVKQTRGKHELVWDGLDEKKQPVPDEAYTFAVETGSGTVFDPTTTSGGEVGDLTEARFSEEGTAVYKLPAASRVLVRLGLHDGPMLKTLVDWKPRIGGEITEYWDGYDEDKLIKLRGGKGFTALITYVTLPDATVITYGNSKETYRDYKLGRGKDRPQKPKRVRQSDRDTRLRPEHLVPPAWSRTPRVLMTLPEIGQGAIPQVKDIADVRVDVDPSDRDQVLRDQFEIIFFVDKVFFAEAERGYLPFNWRWELGQLPAGEHVLTVNVSSFKGQVGVASRKVNVIQGKL